MNCCVLCYSNVLNRSDYVEALYRTHTDRQSRRYDDESYQGLQEVDCILAEDTRTSGILMKHFDIKTRMQSHHKFNEHKTVEGLVARLQGGENIALISDAGTPAISDPGFYWFGNVGKQESM